MTSRRFYALAIARLYRWMAACAAGGFVTVLIWRGWRDAVGFAMGALLSAGMFRWFHGIAEAIGGGGEAMPSRSRLAWLGALRYGIIAGGAYGIMEVLHIQPAPIAGGLFVMVAAVLLEILFQLIYART